MFSAAEEETNNHLHEEEEKDDSLLVFFDIEKMQEDGQHVLNLFIVDRTHVFRGTDCVTYFIDWLYDLAENGDSSVPVTVLAHNFQGYDSYPVLAAYLQQKRDLEHILNGWKAL